MPRTAVPSMSPRSDEACRKRRIEAAYRAAFRLRAASHRRGGSPTSVPNNPLSINRSSLSSLVLNPQLALLQPYPFERLRALFAGVVPNRERTPISLSIGEPRHATPPLVLDALCAGAKG